MSLAQISFSQIIILVFIFYLVLLLYIFIALDCLENIESEAPDTTEEEATESVDVVDSTPARKKESIRKKSIPLLDEEHRMSAVIEVRILKI